MRNAIRMLLLTAAAADDHQDTTFTDEEGEEACKAFDEWLEGKWTPRKAHLLRDGDIIRNNQGGETVIKKITPIKGSDGVPWNYQILAESGDLDSILADKYALLKTENPSHLIITGGNSGVEAGVRKAARSLNRKAGGWHEGEPSEETEAIGILPTPSPKYKAGELNCEIAEGTVIISGKEKPCLTWVREICTEKKQPVCQVNLSTMTQSVAAATIRNFMFHLHIRKIHITGNTEEEVPGIGEKTQQILINALREQ